MSKCSLLTSLHRWAKHQEENFVTETLVYLLNLYLEYEPHTAEDIIRKITGNKVPLSHNNIQTVSITTQVYLGEGIPDIKIENNNFLAFIEVKIDSDFGNNQLSRYKSVLSKDSRKTALITLTRYDPNQHKADVAPDYSVKWHQVADWLYVSIPNLKNTTTQFITREFIYLLQERRLAMRQVNWQLEEGVRSLTSLIDMLKEALDSCKVEIHQRSAAWDWIGYYLEKKTLFIGIYYDSPGLLTINTEAKLIDNKPIPPTIGFYKESTWRNQLDLYSEDVHFFSRSKASQITCLEDFIKENVKYGLSLIDL